MRWARFAHLWLMWLFLVALVAQFFLAGAGAFGALSWDYHNSVGFFLTIGSLVLLILALLGRSLVKGTLALAVAMVVQLGLGESGEDQPWLGALHAVNALVVIGIAHVLATRARRSGYAPADAPEPVP